MRAGFLGRQGLGGHAELPADRLGDQPERHGLGDGVVARAGRAARTAGGAARRGSARQTRPRGPRGRRPTGGASGPRRRRRAGRPPRGRPTSAREARAHSSGRSRGTPPRRTRPPRRLARRSVPETSSACRSHAAARARRARRPPRTTRCVLASRDAWLTRPSGTPISTRSASVTAPSYWSPLRNSTAHPSRASNVLTTSSSTHVLPIPAPLVTTMRASPSASASSTACVSSRSNRSPSTSCFQSRPRRDARANAASMSASRRSGPAQCPRACRSASHVSRVSRTIGSCRRACRRVISCPSKSATSSGRANRTRRRSRRLRSQSLEVGCELDSDATHKPVRRLGVAADDGREPVQRLRHPAAALPANAAYVGNSRASSMSCPNRPKGDCE